MSLEQLQRDWTRLGAADPYWAVCVARGKKRGRWDIDDLMRTGSVEIAAAMDWLDELGIAVPLRRVLDFGSGVGRLSQALADCAEEVTGVDISPTMISAAQELDTSGGRCQFVLNTEPDLRRFADGGFDLVYSSLVLQHLPRQHIAGFLGEFLRVTRPGGVVIVQTATRPLRTARGLLWRYAPNRLLRLAQRVVLRYPAPMRMTGFGADEVRAVAEAHGGVVAASRDDHSLSPDWVCTRYVLRRI